MGLAVRVYVGYDRREEAAYQAARRSLKKVSPEAQLIKLETERLEANGLFRRPMDRRGGFYDFPSNAPCATEFAISRFMVPMLAHSGWALFVDCDVVFLSDVKELFALADHTKAVMVVKHAPQYGDEVKMDGQAQTRYHRKNWSSVILWNCDHPANRRLTVQDVNGRPGRDLHQFYWLHDDEIGRLPQEWNWLVGVQAKPMAPKIAHFTLGGPWFPTWKGAEHDEIWLEASRNG